MTQEIITQETGLMNEDWFQLLLDDCQAIKIERETNAREEILNGKWELGKRISEENDDMDRKKVYGNQIVLTLSNTLGNSVSDLHNCVQFYQEYKVDSFEKVALPEGKNISWYKMVNNHLGNRGSKVKKVSKNYKLEDILEVFKFWFINQSPLQSKTFEEETNIFKELLLASKEEIK